MKKYLKFLILFLIILLFTILFYILKPKFHTYDFKDSYDINVGEEVFLTERVCYGNFIKCSDIKPTVTGDLETNTIGKYNVLYTYNYKNKKLEHDVTINVVDNIPPIIETLDNEYYYCKNGKLYNYNIKATDNYDNDVTSKVNAELIGDKIKFSVSDSSSNYTEKIVQATLKSEKPIITLDKKEEYILVGESLNDDVKASDYCDGDLTNNIVKEGNVLINTPGEYKITYKVVNSSGISSSVVKTYYVYKKNNYDTPTGKSIYLTFDDGPSKYTSGLLDILKKYDVKATFFVTDQSFTHPYNDVIKRAYNEGHAIGLHSSTHSYSYIYSSIDNYFNDLYSIQNKVKNITGYTSYLVRLPGGSSNTVSKSYDNGTHIMSSITNKLEINGFRYFDWNITSGDAGETTVTNKIISNVTSSLGNNSTYVILQHDTKKYSIDAVESIIKYGLSHGYTFRKLSMESPNVHHKVNN